MAITIAPNTFCIPDRKETRFHVLTNNIRFDFSCLITSSFILLRASVNHIKHLSIVFEDTCFKPFLLFEFVHKPSQFECKLIDNSILVTLKSPFTSLEEPKTIVQPRIERDLTKNFSYATRCQVRCRILVKYMAKKSHTAEEEMEVIPLTEGLTPAQGRTIFFSFALYESCTAFIQSIIYRKPDSFYDEMIESHFKKHVLIKNASTTEYTIACLEYFILRNIPAAVIPTIEPVNVEHHFAYKFLRLLAEADNPLKIVQAKYDYTTDISSYPVWLQAHFLKEYLAAPKIIESEKESCLFHLLSIYLDLKMEQSENFRDLKKLAIARSLLPKRECFTSDESDQLSTWILSVIQNLHKNECWSSSLRQKVCEISDLLELGWMFPDTYREAYYPALYQEAKKEVLPFQPIADLMLGEIIFRPHCELFYHPLNVTFKDVIVPFKAAINSFVDSNLTFLLIEGPRGSGKTASILNYADEALMNYSDNESYIPFFQHNKALRFPEHLNPEAIGELKRVPFLFIFDELNTLEEIPHLKEWKKLFPKAKFILISRNKLDLDEQHASCEMLPLRTDEIPSFYINMYNRKVTLHSPEFYANIALKIQNPTLLHLHLLTKLFSRFLKSNNLEKLLHSLDIEWDKSKNPDLNETKTSPSLNDIIKWFRKLNQLKSH